LVHYADPHAPYLHPEKPELKGLAAQYGQEVKRSDREFGRLLENLKKQGHFKNTLIVVFSDHGENLGDHGDAGGHHGVSIYDEVVRVPLLIAGPGLKAGRVKDPVSLIDLAPTLLELKGLPPLPGADGRSLAGYLLGEPPEPSFSISEFYDFGHRLRSITEGRFKLIIDQRNGTHMFFDVITDPGELKDLSEVLPEDRARLQRNLDLWIEDRADPSQRNPERCKALVY